MLEVVLRGPFWYPDSYSNDNRNIAMQLLRRDDMHVSIVNTPLPFWKGFNLKIPRHMAEALKKAEADRPRSRYIHVQHVSGHVLAYDTGAYCNIGSTMFETDRVPTEWIMPCMSMEEVWVPTTFCHQVFATRGLNNHKRIRIRPLGYDPLIFNPNDPAIEYEPAKGKIKFGCCFDWTFRKNGINLIGAFLRAFKGRKDVVLVLKVYLKNKDVRGRDYFRKVVKEIRESEGVGADPQIILFDEILPDSSMGSFYRSLDWHVSITHGEGFNKPVLEAMACGVPSIVTNWSGHLDFCNGDNSLPIIDSSLGPVPPAQLEQCGSIYEGVWAYPNNFQVIENMMYAANMPREQYLAMRRACLDRAKDFTWERVGDYTAGLIHSAHKEFGS